MCNFHAMISYGHYLTESGAYFNMKNMFPDKGTMGIVMEIPMMAMRFYIETALQSYSGAHRQISSKNKTCSTMLTIISKVKLHSSDGNFTAGISGHQSL